MSDANAPAVKDTNFDTGAVRSAERNHLDFTSLPLVGLLGVARTASEGATKYGRFNYMKGMPVHDLINHVIGHYMLFLLGDRNEPHLDHAAWGALAASQSMILDPGLSEAHLLGPGATLTPANLAFLAANAPDLAAKRASGAFSGIGGWDLSSVPEIEALLADREVVKGTSITRTKEVIVFNIAGPAEDAETLVDLLAKEEIVPVVEKKKRRTKAEMAEARQAVVDALYSANPVVQPAEPDVAHNADEESAADAPIEGDPEITI